MGHEEVLDVAELDHADGVGGVEDDDRHCEEIRGEQSIKRRVIPVLKVLTGTGCMHACTYPLLSPSTEESWASPKSRIAWSAEVAEVSGRKC